MYKNHLNMDHTPKFKTRKYKTFRKIGNQFDLRLGKDFLNRTPKSDP